MFLCGIKENNQTNNIATFLRLLRKNRLWYYQNFSADNCKKLFGYFIKIFLS